MSSYQELMNRPEGISDGPEMHRQDGFDESAIPKESESRPSYQEFMNRPEGIPDGIEVHHCQDGFDEIVISEGRSRLTVILLLSLIPAFVLILMIPVLILMEGPLSPLDGSDRGVALHSLLVVFIISMLFVLYRLKKWLTKTIIRVHPATGNFSLRSKWIFGETDPVEFEKGTGYPRLAFIDGGMNSGRRRKVYYELHVEDVFVGTWARFISRENQEKMTRKFVMPAGVENKKCAWAFQLIQAIQGRDMTVPKPPTMKDIYREARKAYREAMQGADAQKLAALEVPEDWKQPDPDEEPEQQGQDSPGEWDSLYSDSSPESGSDQNKNLPENCDDRSDQSRFDSSYDGDRLNYR